MMIRWPFFLYAMDKRIPCFGRENDFHSASTYYNLERGRAALTRSKAELCYEVRDRKVARDVVKERTGQRAKYWTCRVWWWLWGGGCATHLQCCFSLVWFVTLNGLLPLTKPASKLSFLDFIFIQCNHRLESIFWSHFNDRIYGKKTFLFVGKSHI